MNTVEKHEHDDRYEIVLDGETILTREGARQWPPDGEMVDELFGLAEQRLEEANLGNPQRAAHMEVLALMRAAFGQVETVDHRELDGGGDGSGDAGA